MNRIATFAGRAGMAGMAALLLTTGLAGAASPAQGAAAPSMTLRMPEFRAPLTKTGTGRDMPVYVSYVQNTKFDGPQEAFALPEDLVSNTVATPRSQWGGEGADEWDAALGVLAGSLNPYPDDAWADSYYTWTGKRAGSTAARDDDISLVKMWYTSFSTYAVPHTPTGRVGQLAWRQESDWANVLHGTWRQYDHAVLPDGTGVRSPVPTRFTRAMYLHHATLYANGGDVNAKAAEVPAPAFEFRMPAPAGTVMNLQLVGYSTAGPWSGYTEIAPDFNTGRTSGPTGEWRLPIAAKIKAGGFLPERVVDPRFAAPQYAIPITALGIPLAPEEAGPGANEIHLVSNLPPGRTFHGLLALRQPDGSLRTQRLELDEPGPHRWRVEAGRLVAEPGVAEERTLVAQVPAAAGSLAAGEGGEASVTAADEPPPHSGTLSVNEAGRPVAHDIVRDGTKLIDAFDVPRILTPEGPIELSAANRDGRAVVRQVSPASGTGTAAYRAGNVFVLVKVLSQNSWFRTYVETHSLDGRPHPHQVEAVADVADGAGGVTDLLSGPVTRATSFLPASLEPRLVFASGTQAYPFEPQSWNGASVEVRNRGTAPGGELLTDPEGAFRIERDPVWGSISWPLYMTPQEPWPPATGAFSAVKVYRMIPPVIDRTVTVGGTPLEESRDLDGAEQFAIAFAAKRADGSAVLKAAVKKLYISLTRADGVRLFEGFVTPAFTPDGGASWGAVFTPNGELDPAEVHVYARAAFTDGTAAAESSPAVAPADWIFRVDRIPVVVTDVRDGFVSGQTEPFASVTVRVPELGITVPAFVNEAGEFAASYPSVPMPGGDYEVVVEAISAGPAEPEGTTAGLIGPGVTDTVPDDETGSTTARFVHAPGGADPAGHRTGPPADVAGAASFLASRQVGGVFDGGLRPTAWAATGLRAHGLDVPDATGAYMESLHAPGGYAWRAGEPASATATGLAARALGALGRPASLDLRLLLRADGGGSPGADVSSIEGAAQIVLALEATGGAKALDPWWASRVGDYLERATPRTPAEAFARAGALAALGRPLSSGIGGGAGASMDAIAYRALLGEGSADELAPFQRLDGGFTLRPMGDLPEAFPTGLALAALK